MDCPSCGANNDRGEGKCFVCEKPLPVLNAPAAASAPGRARPQPRSASASGEPALASVGDRMIALIFDRIIIGSILLVIGAWGADRFKVQTLPSALGSALAVGGSIF